ncbi:MAG TPA: outer membrane beta-barrel protein [Chitinophagaceae bacterium]|nr:outer membrane beta-barrel protein [Chitinophagaceae bacterium]
MKKLFLFIILFFSFIFSNAQTSFTFLGGIHNGSISPDYLTYPDTTKKILKKKTGIELGLVINFEIKYGFSIRTGFLFSTKGSNWTQFYDTTNLVGRTINVPPRQKNILFSANTLLTTNYIDVPLNLFYSLLVNKKTKFMIGAGPMFSLVFSCYTNFNTLSFSQEPTKEPVAHFEKQFIDLPIGKLPGRVRIFHLGYNAFVGLELGRVSLTANYSKDINEFLEEQGRNYKHKIWGVTFGFNIGGIDAKNTN